tara:strand:+ start:362 stop:541 length:180 start_codon:yes stop_codon:yes gene_type:complete
MELFERPSSTRYVLNLSFWAREIERGTRDKKRAKKIKYLRLMVKIRNESSPLTLPYINK